MELKPSNGAPANSTLENAAPDASLDAAVAAFI
jgi:hypothetical protein